ncbi:MAG: UDP-glucuronate decarboxylase [Parcubacteria group bacterium GW2011_GWD2_43_10]|uniref:NAD-dependent epimerase/dehydratase domain-containing protein n=2 Tax=Candidatus Vebleniibacteriota TaxID=1817921 RepID=A0A1G2Q7Q6_9BACT|nr:MAG: UDP-glucuronate decarboxylase [Parcubacteria group bacterium GW2011_GWA2_42_80]KKS79544.1 MAG: UDP-glucuronate decarboxylase [Parcubacteria group bacterium GW2011_GWD1_42_9]KKS82907.1 MAG: UDP-glucuronate decarboxylase [Parcubacteria group bacterium GW2011_GWD2_43_10]KKS92816.1 MAG: UDP-glucuronate decarboxylase [Parcubacteria group bacterium GW2011_GWE2_43_12]KKT14388.1 MAG: UDP-glucuronate decarboxylase [Parcubacteria group bacterium GW2011_GWF2_43_38]KKT16837.1 MAG: UDP-glucuronate 
MHAQQVLDRPTALVTGGAGFIGSHLCDQLVKNRNVICVDNFITGLEENIDLLLQNPHFKFIRHDLTEPLDLASFPELDVFKVKFQGVQEVYNLACPTSPLQYNRLPLETLAANAAGTKNALDVAFKSGAKIVHASTSAIYGEPTDGKPFTEDYWGYIDPVGPRSCYNEGKRFSESLVSSYGSTKEMQFIIARIFNTYGPRTKLNDGRMIPDMVNKAISNEPMTIYGSADDISTFCYVSDIVDGLIKLMEYSGSGIFNLGSHEQYKLGDIAKLIMQLADVKVPIESKPAPPYLAKQGVPEIIKAKETIGWFPLISLTEGLRQTVDYFRAHHNLKPLGSVGPV